ncbi:MAG: S9 family peptidase [Gammaproteobacteria bacterium]|jgi:dipeptidyl aminopeptidase/acylaminoacyl peptidase|nr:peptidase S9 [Gammaproteobacteria bacterium]MDP6096016.1 S9 family peptidase [Gammaproteobacteria bacterium]HJO12055.1 S9 family peptidase [Gammaproteobacteria bacterium]|tara:strand:- start:539 stop:2539 length:2001 start_codon:yes stop_codon:yes gene_type:complete
MPRLKLIPVITLTCLFVSGPIAAQSGANNRLITAEDFFAIKQVGSPNISPDGEWIAYTVRETNLEEDSSETRLWMVSSDGEELLAMTGVGSSASSPQWSPDGKYLSFMASRNDGETQVWALNRKGGEAVQLSHIEQGVNGYEWSPDGERLVLLVTDQDPEEAADGEDTKEGPWVIDRLQFKRDNIGYLDRLRTHLYVQNLDDDAVTQITSGDYDDAQPVWSPDGTRIAFVSNRTEEPDANSNRDIWVVSADSPDAGATLLQVTTNSGSDSSPAWSPDGQTITYVTVIEPDLIWYATNHLAIAPASGGSARVLTQRLDRNVSSPEFATDGNSIQFIWEESGERHLASIDLTGEGFTRTIAGQRSVRGFSTNSAGQIATLIGEAHLPSEVFLLDDGNLQQLTHSNRPLLDELQLASVEKVQFDSRDGTEVEGFIYKPAGFDSDFRYPTLLRIHGGPVSQYDFNFNFEAQLFAANGYVVVMVNPRGSSGYGQDFSLGIYQDWGTRDFEDVMAGIDYAIEQGFADPDRLGVGGWSYGGILTNYVITKTGRFQGAVTGASEVLYRSNYGHDHYQLQWEKELGLPWENPQAWERISPFNDVANITTPTLIMGGEEDWNVPILNSEQLYQALKRLGRTTQLVVYPGEHHGIRKPSFQLDRFERYLDWYGTHVK